MNLAEFNGDQELGGRLKLWLAERPGCGGPKFEMRRLLDRSGELQERLAEAVGSVCRATAIAFRTGF